MSGMISPLSPPSAGDAEGPGRCRRPGPLPSYGDRAQTANIPRVRRPKATMAEPSAAKATPSAASRPASLPVNGRAASGPEALGTRLPLVVLPPLVLPPLCCAGVPAGVWALPPLVDEELTVPGSWPPPMSTLMTVPSDVVTPVELVPPSAVRHNRWISGSAGISHWPSTWSLDPISLPLMTTRSDLPVAPLCASLCSTLTSRAPRALTSAPSLNESPLDFSAVQDAFDCECRIQTSNASARLTCARAASASAVELVPVSVTFADHGATSASPSGVSPVPMMLPSLEPGLVWSPPETCWPRMLSASAWAPLPLLAACALVLPTVRIPPTSAATADESPGGAGVVVVIVFVVPDVVANAATPIGTDMIGVRASTTVARRTDLRTRAS